MLAGLAVDLTKPSFWASVATTGLCPTIWNWLARREYESKMLSKVFGGPYPGCYALAVWIFSFSCVRDVCFSKALEEQPTVELDDSVAKTTGYGLIGAGSVLVLSSYYQLGITGTYLGDYFGILMDSMVTGFPFNILSDPMYVGSTMSFLGLAALKKSPAGALLSAWVWIVYYISTRFYEGPFTAKIYAEKAAKDQ
eukprot:TRINITY_DN24665_c0_g1_i1.p1 TRINITY_DN24665_c0_g1~~TRINITY_DN24665_c0_g1_i1.p1  ORF type:complete len:196 (+),score=17.22 TRINITY_DN24665_c0_g1_i1:44-631(+)